ncbi:DUF4097 family beta strand repeat-containing protein [Cohnella nanjingensis]|uniref:DUF4097 family beta strand repeat protein n=1 Tax=Cohnella nanjingensis TaxID=1387779 RepID=A0A7X0RLY5_9BACL|nr:DUF4097 family beta strand repeat-containing protein [Cohnella nanjingensis]MBB6669890.1 DUF4097 family beta strand repeat protein [Cohnella nanjingensis]
MKKWLLIALGLILIGAGGLAFYNLNADKSDKTLQVHEQKWTFGSGELRELIVDNEYKRTDVNFVHSTDGTDSVLFEGKVEQEIADRLNGTRISDGSLTLNLKENPRWFVFNLDFIKPSEAQTITVSISDETLLDSLVVKSDSGSLHLNGAAARNAVIKSDSGSVHLADFAGSSWAVSADSGSVHLAGFAGDSLTVKSESGSIQGERIKAKLTTSSDSGSVKLSGVTGAVAVKSESGSVRLQKDDASGVDVKTDSGSVRIQLPEAYGGFYDLKSDSGSIKAPESKQQTKELVKVRTDSGSIRIEQP